jgi:membrane protein implicated in regulation of membrane protease activity|tara:strand:+ start:24694 stop:24993 length:300 start_codon:yes stop_codon:yes gene_type:complete
LIEATVLIFIIISLALFVLIYKQISRTKNNEKTEVKTKQDIIDGYEKLILDVIENNKDDKKLMIEKKTQILKVVSKDLHNNIYFDDDEAKYIISKLAEL